MNEEESRFYTYQDEFDEIMQRGKRPMSKDERDFFKKHLENLEDCFSDSEFILDDICRSYEWMTVAEKKRFQAKLKSHIEYIQRFIK